ncbi:hypothetical protein K3495_g2782 [Podosphaera aphanis]|nr:hypothetical protein K3495_g2782 [Podosphaera aphanis]
MGLVSATILVILAIVIPPLAVLPIAGCGADLLINIVLTILGYFPGQIHALYIVIVYYDRRQKSRSGLPTTVRAPGVFTKRI